MALLISPLHAAEIHYKRKYHLTFAHAKKLFVFDMALLASVVFLTAATLFWYTYDPTVLELVSVSITSSEERIASGDYATYEITYTNHSDVLLTEAHITLMLPEGFEVDTAEPQAIYEPKWHIFTLPNIPPGGNGTTHISGWFYDVPHQENAITAHFSYIQDGDVQREVKARRALTTLRGSVLETAVTLPSHILGSGSTPITISLTNAGERPLYSIKVPLAGNTELHIQSPSITAGTITDQLWTIPELAPGDTLSLSGSLVSSVPPSKQQISLNITPTIDVNNKTIPQQTQSTALQVAHPSAVITTEWSDTAGVSPGTSKEAIITVVNTGDTSLTNVSVIIPLPAEMVHIAAVQSQNNGSLSGQTFTVSHAHNAALREIAPQQEAIVRVSIPIRSIPTGTDLTVALTPRISASVSSVPDATFTQQGVTSPPLKIGTQLSLSASTRYYTDEGDQLGRGPLPPQVGKETKYWAIIEIANSSSNIQNLSFQATLPSYVSWTGKTSVSTGADVQYNPATHQMTWSHNSLAAHQTAGIYAELSLTPTADQRGSTPLLLQNITVTANDTFIGIPLTRTVSSVDASLKNDTKAQQSGVIVQ